MLQQVVDAIDAGSDPVALVGSSLGGFVAVQAALQHPSAYRPSGPARAGARLCGNRPP